MNDRELLEQAAKAANLSYDQTKTDEIGRNYSDHLGLWIWHWQDWFNPLNDDGDALRLASSLYIDVLYRFVGGQRVEVVAPGGPLISERFTQTTISEATRRAIVRAAAEIGKEMK